MITCQGSAATFSGTPRELSMELTYIIGGLKESFIKEYNLSEENATGAIAECIKLGLMNNWERKEYLDSITQDYINEIEFDRL